MSSSIERAFVSWINSNQWRSFGKRGSGAKLFRSSAYQELNMARNYITTYVKSRRAPAHFENVQSFCMFVGHVKSGGTLLGSLLDAHPDMILADELNVLKYVTAGFGRDQIFHLLLKNSRREALKGRVTARRLSPYSFAVPDQWQGRYQQLQVIGDSKAGPTTRLLKQNPDLLQQLDALMGSVNLKLIHVIRNPFDPISVMIVRGQRPFAEAIDHYFSYCATLNHLYTSLDAASLHPVRYETFIADPQQQLADLCSYLGISAEADYLTACSSILFNAPEQSRHMVTWDKQAIDTVHARIAQVPFLSGYSFDQ